MARSCEAANLKNRRHAAYLSNLLLMASAVSSGAPLEDRGWPVFSGDPGGKKYSALTDIDRANVSRLRLAWQCQTGEQPLSQYATSPGMFETTPLMVDGILYLSTPYNRVVALDSRSGREL